MKKSNKSLKEESYNFGVEGFKFGLKCIPALNNQFMYTIPNCEFGDEKGCRIRKSMFKAYIQGWTYANLNT